MKSDNARLFVALLVALVLLGGCIAAIQNLAIDLYAVSVKMHEENCNALWPLARTHADTVRFVVDEGCKLPSTGATP